MRVLVERDMRLNFRAKTLKFNNFATRSLKFMLLPLLMFSKSTTYNHTQIYKTMHYEFLMKKIIMTIYQNTEECRVAVSTLWIRVPTRLYKIGTKNILSPFRLTYKEIIY